MLLAATLVTPVALLMLLMAMAGLQERLLAEPARAAGSDPVLDSLDARTVDALTVIAPSAELEPVLGHALGLAAV